jgi:hypothetical protein
MLYITGMADVPPEYPNMEEIELDEQEMAQLDKAIQESETGLWYTAEEVRDWMDRLFVNWREHGDRGGRPSLRARSADRAAARN